MSVCTKCLQDKKVNDFYRHGKNATCYTCRENEMKENIQLNNFRASGRTLATHSASAGVQTDRSITDAKQQDS